MKRFQILAYDRDREILIAECDSRPEEIVEAVRRKTLRQQVGNRVFYVGRYGSIRVRENRNYQKDEALG
jgi:hypothetical protein